MVETKQSVIHLFMAQRLCSASLKSNGVLSITQARRIMSYSGIPKKFHLIFLSELQKCGFIDHLSQKKIKFKLLVEL